MVKFLRGASGLPRSMLRQLLPSVTTSAKLLRSVIDGLEGTDAE